MKTLTIDIEGHCPTQGSVKTFAFKSKKTGRLGSRVVHQNDKAIKEFRAKVRSVTAQYHDEFFVESKEMGYVIEIVTYIERPKTVERPLPTVKTKGTGDIDKICRAVLDSLTYDEDTNPVGLYLDDSQVVKVSAIKLYTNDDNPEEHTTIKVTKILLGSNFAKSNTAFEESPEQDVKDKI